MFPNFSWHGSPFIRVWHPRGPDKTEVWSYCIVDKEAPAEIKEALRRSHTMAMGPSGNMEQDDENNWIQCTNSGKGLIGPKYPVNLQLRLGREGKHEFYPGAVAKTPTESNQRSFYNQWAKMMDAASWSDVRLDPRTMTA